MFLTDKSKKVLIAAIAVLLCFSNPGVILAGNHNLPQYYSQLSNYGDSGETGDTEAVPVETDAESAEIVSYVVQPGDTLYSISRKYGITIETLVSLNNKSNPHRIYPGEELEILNVSKELLLEGERLVIPHEAVTMLSRGVNVSEAAASAVPLFGWPLQGGTITSTFGWREDRFHYGLDIAAPQGTPVFASAAGEVTYSDYRGTYGLLVEIDHGRYWSTRYAHNSRVLVHPGQRVDKGDTIAEVGSTGYSTGPHVHFEVIYNGERLNPQKYLAGER